MSALLAQWLNNDVELSQKVTNLEEDFANGYLFGELLCQHSLLPSMAGLVDKETPSAKVQNLTICQQALLDLGVKFNSKIANELMTETKGTAVNMCYQLKLGLENAKDGGGKPVHRRGQSGQVLLGSTLKPQRTLLTKHEAMQAEHFEALVKQQVQDPKQLAHFFGEISGANEFIEEYNELKGSKEGAEESTIFTFQQKKGVIAERRYATA